MKPEQIIEVPAADIQNVISRIRDEKQLRLKLLTATDERSQQGHFKIWYIFLNPESRSWQIFYITPTGTEFPSVAHILHEAWDYERKIQTFFGLTPAGHPDARPLLLHENWPEDLFPLRKDFPWQTRPPAANGTYHFQKVKGEGIYEVSVGPVHAGIIEPGYFKISVAGEMMVLLEPRLGYTHKGSEKLFETLPLAKKIKLSEKISGDSSFSHSLAFCQALEQLASITVPRRMRYLRVIYGELERLANHLGDIGALTLDCGYNFGGAQNGRLREVLMQMNERLTGSRFLRGVNVVGGVTRDISAQDGERLGKELAGIAVDFTEIIEVMKNSSSLLNRLKGAGALPHRLAFDRGVLGVAAKALGLEYDTRLDMPYAAYDELAPERIEPELSGDAYARFSVRVKEVYTSIKLIQEALRTLPAMDGPLPQNIVFEKNSFALGCVEGWRGEILYFVATDSQGTICRVAPRDPSFINWPLLKNSAFDNIIPDFPLINKSYNLSYSGNDL